MPNTDSQSFLHLFEIEGGPITIKEGRDGLADCQEPETSKRGDEKTANSKKGRLSYSKVTELLGTPRDQRKLSA